MSKAGIVLITIGIPGSGKSTFIKEKIKAFPDAVYINADSIREELTGDAGNGTRDRQVWNLLDERYLEALRSEKEVIALDCTFTRPKRRKPYIQRAKSFGYIVHLLFMDCPLELAIKRQDYRDRKVPIDVIKTMYDKLTGATEYEEINCRVHRITQKDSGPNGGLRLP
jgi:predicted kinase